MRHSRIAVALLATAVLAGGAMLQAAQVATGEIEAGLRSHGITGRQSADVLQAYRGAVNVGLGAKRVESIIMQALGEQMEIKALVRCLTLTTDAALNGLPAGTMLSKFSEGLAKHARPDEIVEALERRALSLVEARRIIGNLIYEDQPLRELDLVLVAVAGALERGVREGELRDALRREGAEPRGIISVIDRLK